MTRTSISSYLNQDTLPFPFCPGCGHGTIINALDQALVNMQLDPHKLVIVSDIGCSGLSDKFFSTNAFHGLHGRSITYATGIKMMDPSLEVIVLIGDGGCGIGGQHLINAARRNIGITTLVFNNLNYGMTGGEHSVSTPLGAITSTTYYGQLEQPMDICGTVIVNGASFVARTTSFDKTLPELITKALSNEGFSLIDIWELCTAYFVPNNNFNRNLLESTMQQSNYSTGILHNQARSEYSQAYRQGIADQYGEPAVQPDPISPTHVSKLDKKLRCVIAGAAGSKIVSAATIFAKGAILAGLHASQRNDYPVTVKTGYSISEVIISPQEILFTGIKKPDLMLVLFPEGLYKVKPMISLMNQNDKLFINQKLLPVKTNASIVPLDLKKIGRKQNWAISALSEMLRITQVYPIDAIKEAVSMDTRFAEQNLAAIEAGCGISEL